MTYGVVTASVVQNLCDIVGRSFVFEDDATRALYGRDQTEDLEFKPAVVVKPDSARQISEIVSLAAQHRIPVTPIGGRTGLSGGALSIYGGIGLSLERMNRILSMDTKNLQITVEPGVITEVLRNTVATYGLFYPPDPSSQGSCFIGGNVAENAGGARAVKYGTTKDYVLSLEVVLPSGEIIQTGAHTLKNATGYNLTQLMVGSEGTLGIVTKIVLKLLPANRHTLLMLVPFYSAGVVPSALEFMERNAIEWTLRYVDGVRLSIGPEIEAHLLIELDGNHIEVLLSEAEKIASVLEAYQTDEVLLAESEADKAALWKLRRAVGEAVKSNSVYKEEDTVVPRFSLPELLRGVKEIGAKYGFESVCYGHAGDGNLHVNIIRGTLTSDQWKYEVPKGIREIFELTVRLNGTLSGEHGIGLVQKNYMDIAFDATSMHLMRGIKRLFDPLGIMNPGKIFPDDL